MLVEIIRPLMYQGVKYRPAVHGANAMIEIDDDLLKPLIDGQYVKIVESPPTKPKKTKPKTDEE